MNSVSDWAILNDTKSKQLERILAEFHHQSESEINRACILLECYHAVYRRDRLEQRRNQLRLGQANGNGRCLPPTGTQLREIARRVNAKATLSLGTEEVSAQLQDLARRLQQYQHDVRQRLRGTTSWAEPWNGSNYRPKLDPIQSERFICNGQGSFVGLYAI